MDKTYDVSPFREAIRIIIRNLGVLEKDESSCCGITIAQCQALVEIGRAEKMSLNELADLLKLDNSTMSRTVNNLVNGNLAVRELDASDRRYINIKLTDKGYETFKGIEDSMESYYKRVLHSIPKEKREEVLSSLQLLLEALEKNKCC